MKVLEQKVWSVQVTCTGHGNNTSGCGSLLEVEKEDIRYYPGKSGDPATDGTFFYAPEAAVIRCPSCSALTDLSKEQRPADWKKCKEFSTAWRINGPSSGD
jgi:hypothetical protein